jgi:phosphate transport system substrate-binding protein
MATAHRGSASSPDHGPRKPRGAFAATLLCVLLTGVTRGQSVEPPTAIIINEQNPVSSLTLQEIQALFRDERHHWAPGRPATVVLTAQGSLERSVALRTLYEMNELAYTRYWTARIYRAQSASAPIQVESASTVARVVATLPGGIGVARLPQLPKGVKMLRIDGTLPGDPGYPLQ